ncbi:RNA polymerase sigma factor [Demequina activiva]|uniref:Sigma-70 family RNA polymerase sigma factor n=1 Tax=Demequina activiva TaxID=1582364 RepID=A0A919Q5A3_9MICO|nr:RNA polymerase sigma factor [Demequina activiva]GIG55146.1 hypothetical protein Dac01nite_18980 [Demequina activiva]
MALGEYFASTLIVARKGATWAWEQIYRDLYGPLFGFLRGVGPPEEAEDLVSETFLSVARDIHAFDGDEDAFRAWVFTIARRRAVDAWRSRGRTVEMADGDPFDLGDQRAGGDVEAEALSSLALIELSAVIKNLSATQREVLMLRVVADLSVKDTAVAMEKSEGAVRVLQNRAITALRASLGRDRAPSRDCA